MPQINTTLIAKLFVTCLCFIVPQASNAQSDSNSISRPPGPHFPVTKPSEILHLEPEEARLLLELNKPVAQTVWTAIFIPMFFVFEGVGIWAEVEASKYNTEHSDDVWVDTWRFFDRMNFVFYQVVAIPCFIIGTGAGIAGTVMGIRAKNNWDKYDALKAKLNLSFDPQKQQLGAVVSFGL